MALDHATAPSSVQRRGRAMGTSFHIVVVAAPERTASLAHLAETRIRELEARWTRFRPTSELASCHRHSGRWVEVSRATLDLIDRAQFAWSATSGRFDPTMLHELRHLGYDRPYDTIRQPIGGEAGGRPLETSSLVAEPRRSRCGEIEIDRRRSAVRLPSGVGLDVGGIGKGYAADLITAELLDRGAVGSLVNLGGDLRVRGTPPTGVAWNVAVREPSLHHGPLAQIAVTDGAVATSTAGRRRWSDPLGVERHHVLDPTTGLSTTARPHDVVIATAIAGSGWWAEVAATASIGGPTEAIADVDLLTVTSTGAIRRSPHFERFER